MRVLMENMTLGSIKLLTFDTDEATGRKGWRTVCTNCGYGRFRDNVYLTRETYMPICKNCNQQVKQDVLLQKVMLDGISMTLKEASRSTGIPVASMEKRMKKRLATHSNKSDHWVVFGRLPRMKNDSALADYYTPRILGELQDLPKDLYERIGRTVKKILLTPFPVAEEDCEPSIPASPVDESYDFFAS